MTSGGIRLRLNHEKKLTRMNTTPPFNVTSSVIKKCLDRFVLWWSVSVMEEKKVDHNRLLLGSEASQAINYPDHDMTIKPPLMTSKQHSIRSLAHELNSCKHYHKVRENHSGRCAAPRSSQKHLRLAQHSLGWSTTKCAGLFHYLYLFKSHQFWHDQKDGINRIDHLRGCL